MKHIQLCQLGTNQTVEYAVQEIKTALHKVLDTDCHLHVRVEQQYPGLGNNSLWIGLMEQFPHLPAPVVSDPVLDDAIHIEVNRFSGIIAGINPRSVLLAAYRFLAELGFNWIRPGDDGEIVPEQLKDDVPIQLAETASYRHRGICIEGAVSYDHVADLIDWAPKLGFNSYFIQFMRPYTFFERWYTHRNNPYLEPEPFDLDKMERFVEKLEKEIHKRGLIYHAVGHGWTCEPFGIPGLGWEQKQYEADPEVVPYLAEVGGRRGIWDGIPLNTNLCYSNPEARRIVIDSISNYLTARNQIDVLHVWLADDSNNQCECDNCRKAIPSDFYVRLLNELDEKLTEEGLPTKIAFLIYVDLLWPPEMETFINPERFILMFAPITRTYSSSFRSERVPAELPRYERNKLKFSKDVGVNLGLLQGWQQLFEGDSFDFDYHFMWDHYKDPGYYRIAELLSEDLKNLRHIGLQGYISCQVQRAFFPTGLGMYVMGKTLWNDQAAFEALANDYFRAAFGVHGDQCREYMAQLSELFDPPYIRGEKEQVDPEYRQRLEQIPERTRRFQKVIHANGAITNHAQNKSWEYMSYHADLCELLAAALALQAGNHTDNAVQVWQQAKDYAQKIEKDVQPAFDVFEFIQTWERQVFQLK